MTIYIFKKIKSSWLYILLHNLYSKITYKLKPIKGKNNKIYSSSGSRLKFDIVGNNNTLQIDQSAVINCLIYIRGNNHHIKIGKNVRINSGELWLEDDYGKIIIDNNTTIESAHIAVTEPNMSVTIGEDCMLSTGIEIRTGDSHSIIDTTTNKRINQAQSVAIKDHVWIGSNVSILKGCVIEENAIIATRSVVTKNIKANSIAGGIPAKEIRNNVNWLRERIYER